MAVSLWNPLVLAVYCNMKTTVLHTISIRVIKGKAFPHSYSKELYAKINNLKGSEHKT